MESFNKIDIFNSIDLALDARIRGLIELYQIIPTKPNKSFFPNTITQTTHYQNILAELKYIRDELPEGKGLIIVDQKPESKSQYKSEFDHKLITLVKNVPIEKQIPEFLHPNWYIDNATIIEEDASLIKEKLFDQDNNYLYRFNSKNQYKTTTKNKKQTIDLKPKGRKEQMLQIYALKRVQWLHDNAFKSHYNFVSDEKYDKQIIEELTKTYKIANPIGLANHPLGKKEIMFTARDGYYEAKNIFILNDILDALKEF